MFIFLYDHSLQQVKKKTLPVKTIIINHLKGVKFVCIKRQWQIL